MVASGAPFLKRSICSGEKLLTPMARIFPSRRKRIERSCRLLERDRRVRPMHLIDVDDIGLEAAKRILELAAQPRRRGVAQELAACPVEPDLGGDDRTRSPAALERLADQLLGAAEAIARCGVDEIDAVIERGVNGADRVAFLGAAPHHPPMAQVPRPMREASKGNPAILICSMPIPLRFHPRRRPCERAPVARDLNARGGARDQCPYCRRVLSSESRVGKACPRHGGQRKSVAHPTIAGRGNRNRAGGSRGRPGAGSRRTA